MTRDIVLLVKCREMSFYIDPEVLESSMAEVSAEVLPRFLDLPHFRGYSVLKSDHGSRRQVRVMSFWDDGLEGSEEASQAFIDAVYNIIGSNPSREVFEILGAMLIDGDGVHRVELP